MNTDLTYGPELGGLEVAGAAESGGQRAVVGKSKIGQLEEVTIFAQRRVEDIVRLQVTVDQVLVREVVKGAEHLLHHVVAELIVTDAETPVLGERSQGPIAQGHKDLGTEGIKELVAKIFDGMFLEVA
jgi:hypothetical protein